MPNASKSNTRKIVTATAKAVKPAKPGKQAVAPVAADTKPVAVPAVAKPSANVTRTAATIAARRTNFNGLSDRDTAYLGFYRRLAAISIDGILTVAGIVASGMHPPHIGSNKPHDAGVIVRGIKAGLYSPVGDSNGHAFTITELGRSTRAADTTVATS